MRARSTMLILGLSLTALTFQGFAYRPSHPHAIARVECKVSPKILWGLALAESDMRPDAISKDGQDRGMFQFRKAYDKLRGIVNPFDPVESVGHAIKLLSEKLTVHKKTSIALASYRQGDYGVKRDGITKRSTKYIHDIITAFI
jgi:hypothetical protein